MKKLQSENGAPLSGTLTLAKVGVEECVCADAASMSGNAHRPWGRLISSVELKEPPSHGCSVVLPPQGGGCQGGLDFSNT